MRNSVLLTLCALLAFAHTVHAQQTVFINEAMASNDTTIADEKGNYDDWFELYNSSPESVDLTNYYVTDDLTEPTKCKLSGIGIPANGFLILWASGSGTAGNNHVPFKLSASGESIYLYQPDGVTLIDSMSFGQQKTDVSYGRVTDGASSFGYFKQATPGGTNNTSQTYLGFLSAPVFSVPAGFYANSFQLSMTNNDPTASIIYTTNGSIPDINNLNGTVYRYKNQYPQVREQPYPFLYDSFKTKLYSQAIKIIDASTLSNRLSRRSSTTARDPGYYPRNKVKKATIVRAMAVKDGYISSPETVATYFVNGDGINHYTLPVISLGIQENYLFNYDSGIYCAGVDYEKWRAANPNTVRVDGSPANYQRETEYPMTIELFDDSAETRTFESPAGFQMHGGWSRAKAQKSMNVYFRGEYGNSSLSYKVFPNLPYTSYKRFILRNSGQDELYTHIRDMASQAAISHLKFDSQSGRPAVVYIDGEYNGVLNIRTKYDQFYFQQVYGINEDELDYLEDDATVSAVVNDGDSLDYVDLRNFVGNHDMTKGSNYDSASKRMDMANYMDVYIAKVFYGCTDWPHNNMAYFRKRGPLTPDAPFGQDGKWRWIMIDNDSGLGAGDSVSQNTLNLAAGLRPDLKRPQWSTKIFSHLAKNTNFRNGFVNRYCDLLNTTFLPANMISVITRYHDILVPEIAEYTARWRQSPLTVDDWNNNVNAMDTFLSRRPAYASQHLQNFYSLGNRQPITLNVSDTSAGFIHINSIDVTPAFPGVSSTPYPWSGYYFPEVPVTLSAVAKQGYHFSHWQGDTTSTSDTISIMMSSAKSFVAVFEKDYNPTEQIISYWHFNNLPQAVTLASVNADTTVNANAVITYQGTGAGYMDASGTTEGSGVNAQFGQVAGTALRPRNPSDTRYLLITAPTTNYQNIKFKCATVRTSSGAQYQRISYTTDGNTWILKQDSILVPYPETGPFGLDSVDLSSDVNTNNNPLFAVKIEFFGSQANGSKGNNRFDNITVSGLLIPGSQSPAVASITTNVAANKLNASNKVSVKPNPTSNSATLQYEVKKNQPVTVNIFSITGRILRTYKYNATTGLNSSTLPLNDLSSGMYVVVMYYDQAQQSFKVIKQ